MYVLCTAETLKDTIRELKSNGYTWMAGDMPTELITKTLPNTKYIMINAYFDETFKRKIMTYQSEAWYKKHEQI